MAQTTKKSLPKSECVGLEEVERILTIGRLLATAMTSDELKEIQRALNESPNGSRDIRRIGNASSP